MLVSFHKASRLQLEYFSEKNLYLLSFVISVTVSIFYFYLLIRARFYDADNIFHWYIPVWKFCKQELIFNESPLLQKCCFRLHMHIRAQINLLSWSFHCVPCTRVLGVYQENLSAFCTKLINLACQCCLSRLKKKKKKLKCVCVHK